MTNKENPVISPQRIKARYLLSILLSIYVLIISVFLFAPDILRTPVAGNAAFTLGLVVAFLFILFIIFITWIYAYPGQQESRK